MTNMIMGPPIFAPLALRHQRLSWPDCFLSAARRRESGSSGALAVEIRPGWLACFPRAKAATASPPSRICAKEISAPGRDRHRRQRTAQRIRSLLLALQEQFPLRGPVDPDCHRAAACRRCLRLGQRSRRLATTALPALSVVAGSRRRRRLLLSRARRASPAGRHASICSTTSCTGRRSLLRCSLAPQACWAFSPACCARRRA